MVFLGPLQLILLVDPVRIGIIEPVDQDVIDLSR